MAITAYIAGVASEGDRREAWTDQWIRYDWTFPLVRACENGRRAAIVHSLSVVANGRGGPRLGSLAVYNLATGGSGSGGPARFEAAGSAQTWFGFGIGAVGFDSGQPIRTSMSADGSFWFSRTSGGPGAIYDSYGSGYGGSLAGAITFEQCPAAPSMLDVTPSADGRSATVRFQGHPTDDGGGNITGWRLARARDAGFTQEVVIINSSGTSVVSGLTPGVTYYWKAIGRNWASDWAGALGGIWSAPMGRTQPAASGGKILGPTGSWDPAKWKIHGGAGFVDAKVGIYDGTKFVVPK